MAKPGIDGGTAQPFVANIAKTRGWILCVGAGVSQPAFPSWGQLVARLVERVGDDSDLASELLRSLQPDALIEAAQDLLGASDEEFAAVLQDLLYQDLRVVVSADEYGSVCNAMAARLPYGAGQHAWEDFLRVMRTHFPGMTALGLAGVLADVVDGDRAPRAILSFNAEPLLLALVNAVRYERGISKPGSPVVGELRQVFDYVTHSFVPRESSRIPYVFCHGMVPVPDPGGGHKRHSAVDKCWCFQKPRTCGWRTSRFPSKRRLFYMRRRNTPSFFSACL